MRSLPFALIMAAVVTLSGCDTDTSPNSAPPPETFGFVDVLHASADAPPVNVLQRGTTLIEGLDFAQGALFRVNPGNLELNVDAVLPDGSNPRVIGPAAVTLEENERITAIAVNDVANIGAVVLEQSIGDIPTGQVQVRVVHAAPAAPMVDVYVSAPGADITQEAPLGTIAYQDVLGPMTVAAATYQVTVTVAGDPATIVFQNDAALPANVDAVVAAVANTLAGGQPINLLVAAVDPAGTTFGAVHTALLQDATAGAALRFVHASPDAPNVDVIANDDFAALAVSNLAYTEVTGDLNLPAGEINTKVVPAGVTTPVVIDATLDLEPGSFQTVLATGLLADIAPLVISEDRRRVATEARVRIVHGSPSAGNVDIYVVAPGADIATATPAFSDVPFRAETGIVPLTPGGYDVVVTPTGSTDAAIGPLTLTFEGGELYTAVARDEFGSGTPLGLIVYDDFL